MASPQLGNGFSRIANELLEAIMSYPFGGSQLRILLAVGRECYGRNGGRKLAPLSYGQIATATGLNLRTVQREVTRLLEGDVLVRQSRGVDRLYGLQKNYDRWKVREIGHSADGQSADGDLTVEESVNQPTEESVNQPTHKKKEEIKKISRAEKQHADPRYGPSKNSYLTLSEQAGVKPVFDASDGKGLKILLEQHPNESADEILQWLRNAFNSERGLLEVGFRFRQFVQFHTQYQLGPLCLGRRQPPQSQSNDSPTTIGEIKRQRAAEAHATA